jgi:hypothetical protein
MNDLCIATMNGRRLQVETVDTGALTSMEAGHES